MVGSQICVCLQKSRKEFFVFFLIYVSGLPIQSLWLGKVAADSGNPHFSKYLDDFDACFLQVTFWEILLKIEIQ